MSKTESAHPGSPNSPGSPGSPLPGRWHFSAAVASWLVPGWGHFLIGQKRRGLILMLAIGLIWLIGLLIGGVSSIDRKDHLAWFLGQMIVAPSVAVDFYHQKLKHDRPGASSPTSGKVAYEPGLGRVKEQGVLYTSLAGLLNLLAIIDVLYREEHAKPAGRPRMLHPGEVA